LRRAEARRAHAEKRTPRSLQEIDYLLGVADEIRPGALRFSRTPNGPFLAQSDDTGVPPLVHLPRLLAAADRVQLKKDSDADVRSLLAPGASLGGSRPEASVRNTAGISTTTSVPSACCMNDQVGRLRRRTTSILFRWRSNHGLSKRLSK